MLRITTGKMSAPRICWVARTILELDLSCVTNELGRRTNNNGFWSNIASYRTVCTYEGAFAYSDAWQHHRHCCNSSKVLNSGTKTHGTGWMGIIRQNDIGKYPHKISNCRFLPYVNVTVESHIVANAAMSLDITQRADLKVITSDGLFTHCHTVPSGEAIAKS